jgi:hypothetical protein
MPWITPSKDPTLAELFAHSNISGGGGINTALLRQPPNQWLEALKEVAPAITNYIQRKKSDEIANQLLRDTGAPQQYQDKGAMGLQAWNQLHQFQESQPDTATDDLNYLKLWQQTHPDESPDTPGNRAMTEYQREQTRLREMDIERKQQHQLGIPPYSRAIARGRLNASGQFDNNYAEAATGEMAQVQTPEGKTITVPWAAYQQATRNPAVQLYGNAQSQEPPASASVSRSASNGTRIIERNGHHYEVDDASRKVLRQID